MSQMTGVKKIEVSIKTEISIFVTYEGTAVPAIALIRTGNLKKRKAREGDLIKGTQRIDAQFCAQ